MPDTPTPETPSLAQRLTDDVLIEAWSTATEGNGSLPASGVVKMRAVLVAALSPEPPPAPPTPPAWKLTYVGTWEEAQAMAADGWELSGVTSFVNTVSGNAYYFKRREAR